MNNSGNFDCDYYEEYYSEIVDMDNIDMSIEIDANLIGVDDYIPF